MRSHSIFSISSLSFCFFGLLIMSCNSKSFNGKLIITQIPAENSKIEPIPGEMQKYLSGTQIVMVDPKKSSSVRLLTRDFYSACSPDVSLDGRYMLFSAQQKENDLWQIWEMDLKKGTPRKILTLQEHCTDPVYLPTGRIVFSKAVPYGEVTAYTLFSCNANGSDIQQITFSPNTNRGTTVLKDGRLLVISSQLYPAQKDPRFMVIRPDGTKADLFYKVHKGNIILSRGRETRDGKLYFIESDSAGRGDLISIKYSRPLTSAENLTSNLQGNFYSVYPQSSGSLWVSYQKSTDGTSSVYEFINSTMELGEPIYSVENMNVTDVVFIENRIRPKKLPSEVDMGVKTGLLLCQDINFTELGLDQLPAHKRANKIEIVGSDSTMGIVKAEEDGSVYLKIIADMPFKIRTLTDAGEVINESGEWLWLRPNERRGCIGCHENPELAPENKVPLSVKKAPVSIPIEISMVHEKDVELE